MRRPSLALRTGLLAACLGSVPSVALAAPPWEDGFSAAPARAILDAATKTNPSPEAEVVVLFQERRQTFAPGGESQHVMRETYLVRSEAAVQSWGSIQFGWEPWHEEKPEIRARVIAPDGRTFVLDPKTIETSTPRSEDSDLYTDRSRLRAPLPGVTRGAVVEVEITQREKAPVFDQGVVEIFRFVGEVPVEKARLVIDAPDSLPVKFSKVNGEGVQRSETRAAGRVVTTYQAGPLAARDPLFPNSPPEMKQSLSVTYSTGRSWQQVAQRYAKMVEERLRGADLQAWAAEATKGIKGREALATALLAKMSRELRYTGIEFGDSAIVPQTPAEVLSRRYGDCKDQAALLVALLREVGVPAHVALLSAGTGPDVHEDLPGLGTFNHAIVYLPGRPELWIDPTDPFTPVGQLPLLDQGRRALVAKPDTTRLILTTGTSAANNLTREERELTLSENGTISIKEHTSYAGGALAAWSRAHFNGQERKELDSQYEKYVVSEYKAKKLGSLRFSDPKDLSKPFQLDLTVESADLGYAGGESAWVPLMVMPVFHDLPEGLRSPEEEEKSLPPILKGKARSSDFFYPMPYIYELVYRIVPAHGFVVQSLPKAETLSFGPARLQFTCENAKDGTIQARYRFETGKNRLTPSERTAFQEAFKAYLKTPENTVQLVLAAEGHLQAEKIKEALAAFRKLDKEHPNTAHHASQLARALLVAGLGESARREAQRAVTLDPGSTEAQNMQGTVLEHDLLGRVLKPGFDRAGAESALRKTLAINAKDAGAIRELAVLSEYDDEGGHTWPKERLKQALEFHERYQKLDSHLADYDLNYLITLFHLGRYQEVLDKQKRLQRSAASQGLTVAATALLKTPGEAIRQVAVLVPDPEQRPEALRTAGAELMALRRYPESVALLSAAANGHKNAVAIRLLAEMLRQTKRREALSFDERDPRQVVKAFFVAMGNEKADLQPFLAKEEFAEKLDLKAMRRAFKEGYKKETEQVPLPVLFDMSASKEWLQEGEPAWGLWVHLPEKSAHQGFFLVPRAGKYRLLAAGSENIVPILAREALRRLDQKDRDAARYLLNQVMDFQSPGGSDDPFASSVFTTLWRHGNHDDVNIMRLAALSTQMDGRHDSDFGPLLEACMRDQPEPHRTACERSLAEVRWRQKRKPESIAIQESLMARFPKSRMAVLNAIRSSKRCCRPSPTMKRPCSS